jgi:replicative DNA helicase
MGQEQAFGLTNAPCGGAPRSRDLTRLLVPCRLGHSDDVWPWRCFMNPVSPADVLATPALPASREAEMALLGAMIFENDVIGDVLEIVSDGLAFAYPAHRILFDTILRLHLERRPIDLVVLRDALARDQKLEKVGGADYLLTLVEGVPNAANAPEYARAVHEKAVLRTIIETCRNIIHQSTQVTEDVDQVREEAERALFQALARAEKSTLRPMTQLLQDTFAELEELRDRRGPVLGLSTGFLDLDDLLGGLQSGQLYVVAGRPSMGKTSLAMTIIEHVAVRKEEVKPVLFFSLEMDAKLITKQMLCSRAHVDANLIRTARFSDEEYQRLLTVADDFHPAKILIDDSADLSALEVRTRARRFKAREGLALVVVDYLQKMHATKGARPAETRQLEIAMISSHLKSMAKELGVPVIALAQLNRAAEGREDRRPLLADLRESGTIEQDADAVMLLYRDEYYHPDSEHKGICEVIVAKNRTGPTGTVELAFIKQYTRFENLAHASNRERAA